tara:strand:- start:4576 stop:5007 length:432 start_codon:yes stop_codon:yes gene_type:complete
MQEIKKILKQNGCERIQAYDDDDNGYGFQFIYGNRSIRFGIKYPSMDDRDICKTETGKGRTLAQIEKAYDQEVRRLFRALLMCLRMKFEIVNSGISCFEDEFMSHTVDPNSNQTYGTMLQPLIEERLAGIDTRPTLFLPGPND